MKRVICLLGLLLCLSLLPQLHSTYGDTIANGIGSEAGFHTVSLTVNAEQTLTPSDLTSSESLTWRSSAPSVVKVDSSGKIQALATGTAVVYATSLSDSSLFDSWMVTVTEQTGQLSLNYRTAGLTVGQTMTLAVTATGSAADAAVSWSSTDSAVVRVSDNGMLTALAQGSAVIFAQTADGRYTASCMVYVIDKTVTMNVSTGNLPEGKTLYNKSSALNSGKIIWTTTNSDVAVVRRGFIEAVGQGQAIITAIREDGTGAQCIVNATAPEPVYSAYMDPNNPSAGTEGTLVIVASPQVDTVRVKIFDSSGSTVIQDFTASTGYTEKTISDRTVRIWRVPVTFADEGTYIVRCSSESFAKTYEFKTLVSPAEADSGETDSDDANSDGTATGVCRSWYTSTELLTFLTKYEGLCQTVVYDVVNVPTIGYGQALFYGSTFYNYQTTDEAWGNMCKLVNQTFVPQLNKFVTQYGLLLNQAQFDALTSYSYNMGAYCWSTYSFKLRTLLIENPDVTQIDRTELKYAFGKQSWTGGRFYTGLYRRRMDEWEMFLTGDYEQHPYSDMTGDFAIPSAEDQRDPDKYGSDWKKL